MCSYDAWMSHPYYDVTNFHRIVVHGSTFPLEWLKLTAAPGAHNPTTATSFGPFTWTRMPQGGNGPAAASTCPCVAAS